MFPRSCFNADGRLRLVIGAPVNPYFNTGVACGTDYVYAEVTSPQRHVNGLPVRTAGELCVQAIDPDLITDGIPITAAGTVAYTASPPTSFVNGMGWAGGRWAIEVVAIPVGAFSFAFSSAFSGGFP